MHVTRRGFLPDSQTLAKSTVLSFADSPLVRQGTTRAEPARQSGCWLRRYFPNEEVENVGLMFLQWFRSSLKDTETRPWHQVPASQQEYSLPLLALSLHLSLPPDLSLRPPKAEP